MENRFGDPTARETITEPARDIPVARRTQVLVVGAGAGGYPAAIRAARNGAEVLLIERNAVVGGTGPMSFVTEFLSCENISGILREVQQRLAAHDAATETFLPEYFNLAYDPEMLKLVVLDILVESGVDLLLNTNVVDVIRDGDALKGVIIENKSGRQAILADVIIDASGDADVAARAGVPMHPREDPQPMMMLCRMGGVDWERMQAHARANPDDFSKLWGTPANKLDGAQYVHLTGWKSLVAQGKEEGALPGTFGHHISIFGATPANLRHGIGYLYAVQVLNRDPTDAADLTGAEIEGRRRARDFLPFVKRIPGMEDAFLIDMAPQIGVRDSRRIVGDYTLTRDDIFEGAVFEDEIALKVYRGPNVKGWVRHKPDGSEGGKGHDLTEMPISVVVLGLPYRCLVPQGIENLLVAGKTVSFDNEAHQRVRLMPECIAMGEAAGVAAAVAVRDGVPPRQVNTDTVRALLTEGGMNLDRAKVRVQQVRETLASRGLNVLMD
ncbi:MAG: FAD-dependent oxidoreductase [Alphaproteobacteria bacterium]|nr:FAD-dependent oxidoreductase [Alphaproteobacteria bacterium]MBU0877507.1 FAD-dependent oxidoreductase [Alphaproteobacteria bacterium]MBU1768289.1 FAD-dependent oxidoreductase [Alphaproteobacteria bacterium]